jgi:hypothetical protein
VRLAKKRSIRLIQEAEVGMGTPTRAFGELISDGLGLVGGDVIRDDVDFEIPGNVGFDDVQKARNSCARWRAKPLPMTLAASNAANRLRVR